MTMCTSGCGANELRAEIERLQGLIDREFARGSNLQAKIIGAAAFLDQIADKLAGWNAIRLGDTTITADECRAMAERLRGEERPGPPYDLAYEQNKRK